MRPLLRGETGFWLCMGSAFTRKDIKFLNYRLHCRKSNFLQSSLGRIKAGMALSGREFSFLDYSLFIKFLSTFLRDATYRSSMKEQWCQDFLRVKFWSSSKLNRVQKDKIAIVVGRQQRYGHTLVFITLNSTNIIHKNIENGKSVSPSTSAYHVCHRCTKFPNS